MSGPSPAIVAAHEALAAASDRETKAREAFALDTNDEHLREFIAAVTARRLAEEVFERAAGRRSP